MIKTAAEYEDLFNSMIIRNVDEVQAVTDKIKANNEPYIELVEATKMPWQFVACVHYRESSLSFTKHLHNGDSLAARTVNVPKGRPLGNPPFTWVESAKDALFTLKHLDNIEDWSLGNLLAHLEAYNGLGYAKYHSNILSPYIWSYTNHYTAGKYASDGHFDAALVDKQIGCAPLLKFIL